MATSLVQIIFEQFIKIVKKTARKHECHVTKCDFQYRTHEFKTYRILDVIYVGRDECLRQRDVGITIDITSICLEDLPCEKWVHYLKKLAREFVNDICPKRLVIVKEKKQKCRPQPPKWEPFPCKTVTTIVRKIKPIEKKPKIKVIVEKECECVPECKREKCEEQRFLVVKEKSENKSRCGDHLVLVDEHKDNKHGWNTHKGNIDYNHHKWPKCCGNGSAENGAASHHH